MRRPPARGGRARLGATLSLCLLLLGACSEGPQSALRPAGEFAREADQLWDLTFGIAAVIFFIVEGVLVFTLIKYRRRPGREASQFHGNTRLEIILTVIPSLILAGIAVPTVRTIFDLAREPAGAMQIEVTGHRFWWEYRYMDENIVTANELHIPTHTRVRLTLEGELLDRVTGQDEVIHSFWSPRLAGKQDLVPGRINHLLIEADEPGVYPGQCTEFCGLGHGYMRLYVIAHDQGDFDTWVAEQQQGPAEVSESSAQEGADLFVNGTEGGQFAAGPACASCHAVEDTSLEAQPNTGPNLTHFAGRRYFAGASFRNNTDNLASWLRDPQELKPGATMPDVGLTEDQIQALVAYLQTLE